MATMTSLERTLAVLDHKVPDRVPVALHNFLMACRMAGGDFGTTLRSGEMLAEAELAAWRAFGHDVIMHENGVCAEAEALGCGIHYPADGPALLSRAWPNLSRRLSPKGPTDPPSQRASGILAYSFYSYSACKFPPSRHRV